MFCINKKKGHGHYSQRNNNLPESDTTVTNNLDLDAIGNDFQQTQVVNNSYIIDAGSNWWINRMDSSVSRVDADYADELANAAIVTPERVTTQLMGYDTALRKPSCQMTVEGDHTGSNCQSFDPSNLAWQRTQTNYDIQISLPDYGIAGGITVSSSDLVSSNAPNFAARSTTMVYGNDSINDGYFPISTQNSLGHTVATQIEPREGNPTMVTDANGLITRMAYDAFGRETETWYPNHLVNPNADVDDIDQHYAPRSSTRYSNNCPGMPSPAAMEYCMTVIADGAPLTSQAMDSLNRALRTHSVGFNDTVVLEQIYNARGQMISDTIPRYLNSSNTYLNEYQYDSLGRTEMKIVPQQPGMGIDAFTTQSLYTHYAHNGLSTQVTVTSNNLPPSSCSVGIAGNPLGDLLCVQRSYASNGWLLSTIDAHGEPTGFWYDGQGNPVYIQDPNTNATTASYNNLGHRLSLDDPNMGQWSYEYNGLGEVISQTDANGVSFSFDYDSLGRLTQRDTAGICDSWDYDASGMNGLLISEQRAPNCNSSATISKQYDYDDFNRPLQTTQIINQTETTWVSASMGYEYDSYFARMKAITWSIDSTGNGSGAEDTLRMYSKYNIHGYLTEQGDSLNYGDPQTGADYNQGNNSAWRQIQTMTPNGQTQSERYGNNLVQTTQHYQATWQMRQTTLPSSTTGNPPLMDYFYDYDLFGNLNNQTQHSLDGPGGAAISELESFSYDRLHRLLDSDRLFSDGTFSDISYTYDALGNITSKGDMENGATYNYCAGSSCNSGSGGPNAVRSVGSNTYTYDNNGNMLTGPDRIISYNAYNKPIRIANASNLPTNEFWYDANEQRYLQRKSTNGNTMYLDKVYERTGNTHKLYVGDFAVFTVDYDNAQGDDTGITYLHKDRLGSMAVMSGTNAEMLPNTGRGFDPFGKPRDEDWMDGDGDLNGFDETTRGFTGHEHLNGSDLIHMNGRAYDYNLGRFLSVDPVIQAPTNSQSLNPYSYIMNNPLAGTDPTGYTSEIVGGGGSISGCRSTLSGSCDIYTFNGSNPDERSNRNGAQGTEGTINMGGDIAGLGGQVELSDTGNLDATSQMNGSDSGFQTFPCRCERRTGDPVDIAGGNGGTEVPQAPGLFGHIANGIQAAQFGINDFTFDQGAEAFIIGEIFNELALQPLQDISQAIENDSLGGVLLATGGMFVRGGSAAGRAVTPTLDDLSRAAAEQIGKGFTAAGKSLTKHGIGARPGNSLFPAARGNPAAISQQAQDIVDDILTAPGTRAIESFRGRFGNTIEHIAPDGRGVVFDANGKFLFFREGLE